MKLPAEAELQLCSPGIDGCWYAAASLPPPSPPPPPPPRHLSNGERGSMGGLISSPSFHSSPPHRSSSERGNKSDRVQSGLLPANEWNGGGGMGVGAGSALFCVALIELRLMMSSGELSAGEEGGSVTTLQGEEEAWWPPSDVLCWPTVVCTPAPPPQSE